MVSRRTFLIGINSMVIAPQVFGAILEPSAQTLSGSGASGHSSDTTLPLATPSAQFKVYGWNADHTHASNPDITTIYLSSTWRSGWL